MIFIQQINFKQLVLAKLPNIGHSKLYSTGFMISVTSAATQEYF